MPLAGGEGSATKGKKTQPGAIQVFNPATNSVSSISTGAPSTGSGGTSSVTKSGLQKGSGSSSSSSASSSTSSAASSYEAAQRKRDTAARDRYVTDAEALGGQVSALRKALGLNTKDGKLNGTFRKALNQRIDNIMLVRDQQLGIIRDGFEDRSASLDEDQRNNEIAASDASVMNETNRGRERASAISEAMAQGAGESDTLKVQMHSIRNWDANQDGINRAFSDGQRSINNSRIDLGVDTRTGLANVYTEANADKQQMWDNFYNQIGESQTQLGNTLGQQAEYYGLAIEANTNAGGGSVGSSKSKSKSSSKSESKSKTGGKVLGAPKGKDAEISRGRNGDEILPGNNVTIGGRPFLARPSAGAEGGAVEPKKLTHQGGGGGKPKRTRNLGSLRERQDAAAAASDKAFMGATNATGKVWDNPGLPGEITNWKDPALSNTRLANTFYDPNAVNTAALKAPEGATLRKW